LLIKDLILHIIKIQDYMHILPNYLEKAKKRTLLFIKLLILGFLTCFILIIILTAYYQGLIKAYYPGSLAPIYRQLTLIEFFWIITLLISFIFLNIIIWYYISYDLIIKSLTTMSFAKKYDDNEIICYKCGTYMSLKNLNNKSNQILKLVKIFKVKGYFCKECYQNYSRISLGTIILVPIIYFLNIIFTNSFLIGIDLSYIPKSYHYLTLTMFPVFFLAIIVFSIYFIYGNFKISKIYGSKEQKFIN